MLQLVCVVLAHTRTPECPLLLLPSQTLWDSLGLVSGLSGNNPVYVGRRGNHGHEEIGGNGDALIENSGGPGTRGGHWSENTYGSELMTGYISGATQPFSQMTLHALEDLG